MPDPSASNRSKASLISCFCSSVSSYFGPTKVENIRGPHVLCRFAYTQYLSFFLWELKAFCRPKLNIIGNLKQWCYMCLRTTLLKKPAYHGDLILRCSPVKVAHAHFLSHDHRPWVLLVLTLFELVIPWSRITLKNEHRAESRLCLLLWNHGSFFGHDIHWYGFDWCAIIVHVPVVLCVYFLNFVLLRHTKSTWRCLWNS